MIENVFLATSRTIISKHHILNNIFSHKSILDDVVFKDGNCVLSLNHPSALYVAVFFFFIFNFILFLNFT